MHYIGMLAFILPIPVAYHWPTVSINHCTPPIKYPWALLDPNS
jgi:NO-binding membrane sensor protein with MHYT domain